MTEEQLQRYARHICLDEIGTDGQEKLLAAKVLIIGAGGLGSPAALYLAAAGIGTIGIADGDNVDISNLQRQIIHTSADIGRPKVQSAKESMNAVDSNIRVNTYPFRLTDENISAIIADYEFIIDCTDNYKAKFLINDACVKAEKPFCHGGINGFRGQLMTYLPKSPCLRCLFDEPPSDEDVPKGVVGAVPGVTGSLQAMEAIKYILGQTDSLLTGCLLTFDTLAMNFRKIKIPENPDCPLCRNISAE